MSPWSLGAARPGTHGHERPREPVYSGLPVPPEPNPSAAPAVAAMVALPFTALVLMAPVFALAPAAAQVHRGRGIHDLGLLHVDRLLLDVHGLLLHVHR